MFLSIKSVSLLLINVILVDSTRSVSNTMAISFNPGNNFDRGFAIVGLKGPSITDPDTSVYNILSVSVSTFPLIIILFDEIST